MIRDTQSKRLAITADFSQANRTYNGQHISRNSGSLPRIVLIFCIVTMICGDSKKTMQGFRELKEQIVPFRSGQCDLEKICDWSWNNTSSFKKVSVSDGKYGPTMDVSNTTRGHFLWFSGRGKPQMWFESNLRTDPHCFLQFWLYQREMREGSINLIIETRNATSISEMKYGNNYARWEKMRFNLGTIGQPYRLFLEMSLPFQNSSVSVDNVTLVNCFSDTTCTEDMFRCNISGSCLNKTRICDLRKDCADGEDEGILCEKIPKNARCNFEDGWCGWTNVPGRPLNWTLHRGPTPIDRTGPSYDNTYRNRTGTYAYVSMFTQMTYGSRATLESPLYNPTPPYSSNPNSTYYQSCQIRFFYHKYGKHSASFGLYLVQMRPYGNLTDLLWWSYGEKGNVWNNKVIALPKIRYRYVLQFEASRGFSSKSEVALDDISLSPECFAIGVPPDVVGDFNYFKPVIDFEKVPSRHPHFENETVIRINTCGASGRTGPTAEQCALENRTDIELFIPSSKSKQEDTTAFNLNGVQRWTAPGSGYYTLIAFGAQGGKGSGGMGTSLGALASGVIELEKGDQLYFMIGQAGTDACPKNLGMTIESCQSPGQSSEMSGSSDTYSKIKDVKNVEFKNGGGGGGGATSIFILKANGEQEPILIAAAGGGLGSGQLTDDGRQHGRGRMPAGKLPPPLPTLTKGIGGPGASWNSTWFNDSDQQGVAGMLLVHGGLGGFGCESGNQTHGDGGFGGGGGGCLGGGGGGGFIGGSTNTGHQESERISGNGGYSYANQKLINVYFKEGVHHGAGEVLIISAISGCDCDYRCVALDRYLNETKCLCPQGWLLSNDSKSCIMIDDSKDETRTYMIPFIIVTISLFIFIVFGTAYYKRHKNKMELSHRRQAMFGNGTELTALRAVSDTMMTEFNPNYEFAGNLYHFKDLTQIPRDDISLVKPLGQGAFGEVFQGVYKHRREEYPVAVKTLPSLSTSQAEADFMMEALIMSKFNHPNVVHFIGVSFDKHPRYIVLELLAGGDLKNFLREERPRPDRPTSLSMLDLIMCGYDVANGCKYMEEARFIHRDIAARNCLLTGKGPGRIVKIADFGMARDIYRSDYYRKGGKAMLPIKWMPPEGFLDGVFTTKTDVWAFGVLLWEIMSFGYMPYTGCANREVMSMVTSGGRLEKPAGCPDPIYGIMTRCWHPRPDDRPSFSTIAERIGYCMQDPDVINHPTPNFDILPICDREVTIMRPDPEAECINVQSDLDGCGYMRPKVIDPRSVARRMKQAVDGRTYNSGNKQLNREAGGQSCTKSVDHRSGTLQCESYNCSMDTFEQTYSDDNDHDDDMTEDCKDRHRTHQSNRQDSRMHQMSYNIKDCDNLGNADNGNNDPKNECHPTANIDNAITDHRNGNKNTTTTDTNSDSQSSDTLTDTTTNLSLNTHTCSSSNTSGFNVNNVNGMMKKNTLKATLSLDPSALYRSSIPCEKITTQTERSSTSDSMELRKDSLNHELPREEECSC